MSYPNILELKNI